MKNDSKKQSTLSKIHKAKYRLKAQEHGPLKKAGA